MSELCRLLEGRDLERTRRAANSFWIHVHETAWKVFGQLAVVAYGDVTSKEALEANYVMEYAEDSDKEELRAEVLTYHGASWEFLDITKLSKEAKGLYLRSYQDFHLERLLETEGTSCTALVGHVGCGKSSLLAYLQATCPPNVLILHDNLAQATSEVTLLKDLYVTLPKQLNRAVIAVGSECGIGDRDRVNELFAEELRTCDAMPHESDGPVEREAREMRRSVAIAKMMELMYTGSREVAYLLRHCVDFLVRHGKRVILVLDDIDRVSDRFVARSARDEAVFLSHVLNVPVLLAVREETIGRGVNFYGREEPIHVCAPSFRQVLTRRLQSFERQLALSFRPIRDGDLVLDAAACHKIAQSVAASILDRRLLFYVFRMLSNGNIQLMLDYYRALLASPNLDRTQLAGLAAGERLSEHRVIEDLMLYVYEKLNPANSFVMNLYNLGDPSVGVAGNALLRIRILQTIATRATYRDGTLGLRRSDLRGDLEAIGYRECAEKNLSRELKQMADYGLIQVMQFPEDPQTDDPIIVLQDAGHLYKDFLIYRYSYLQTVIPDCWLDYRASEPALDGDLHAIDDEIRNFIRFIGRCEKSEKRDLSEEGQKLLKTIAGPWSLAGALRSQFEIERSRQMGKTETK